jgi:archaeal preflagellin peptidase FlaK
MISPYLEPALAFVLVAGLGVASWQDWREREVSDTVWQLMAIVGALGGALAVGALGFHPLAVATNGWLPLALWGVASAFVLEHLFPWDAPLERRSPALPGFAEIGIYASVVVIIAVALLLFGVGDAAVPVPVLAVVATVLLSRALFEVGVLYGGADAKALMVAGLLVPVFSQPLLAVPTTAQAVLTYYPFSLNVLMDAAILAIGIPLALAFKNARSRRFEFPRGFTSYEIPVERLPEEFVWLKDPLREREIEEPETTEEDRALRVRQRDSLRSLGVTRVWVTPQLPFVIVLWGGTLAGLLLGNLLFDLIATF